MKWLVILGVCALFLMNSSSVESKDKKTYALSMKVFKHMEKANLLVEEGKLDEATLALHDLLEKRSSKYEKAQIYSLLGLIHYRNSDYEEAIVAFNQILESAGSMPLALHLQTLKTLTQLSMVREDYVEAVNYCEHLIAVAEIPDQLDYALLAQAHYKLENWEGALKAAIGGRKVAIEQQKNPDENLLLLLNAVYYEQKEVSKMPAVLEEVIKFYPKTSYLLYLASVYGQLDQVDKQLVIMESLYEDGRIDRSSQLRNLASLYMSEKAPYKGAVVLQKALKMGQVDDDSKNWVLLAQAWRMAAERKQAVQAITRAAKLSDVGDNYLQAAYMLFDQAKWEDTENALIKGFDKGFSEKITGEAWLLLGMTRFKMQQFDKAIEACQNASNFKKSTKHAEQWISYISNEKSKYESMQPTQM